MSERVGNLRSVDASVRSASDKAPAASNRALSASDKAPAASKHALSEFDKAPAASKRAFSATKTTPSHQLDTICDGESMSNSIWTLSSSKKWSPTRVERDFRR